MKIWLWLHLITIIPVLIVGPFILFRRKGDKLHKVLGKMWAILMIVSCLFSFGIQSDGGLSWLHGLAAFTIFSVVRALIAIKRKDLKTHERAMRGSYVGACIAFIFAAAVPSRLIGGWLLKIFH
ncbi:MAG: DUF2306 domain-containing protein [Bacteriovoracaceae bacterium]